MANTPFIEERFSTKISFGAKGGPAFNNRVVSTASGYRNVNRMWPFPLHKYDVTQAIRSNAQFEEVRGMFYVCEGRATGFRFKDWADYQANQSNSGVLQNDAGDWQLVRLYQIGSYSYLRPIQKPLGGTVEVYRTRSGIVTELNDPDIDFTTGTVTITDHTAGDTYTWIGEFDVPVAFVSDMMEAVINDKSPHKGLLVSWPDVQLEEIRLRT